MFKIESFIECRVVSLTNRIERHGDDEKPAVSLGLEIEAANTILDQIDPKIREALFKPKPDAEPELPGVEQSTPVLRCNSIDRVTLPTKHEGWTLAVDDNIDAEEPMRFGGVKIDKLSVEPKQGGSIVLRMRLGTSDVDAKRLGWLGMHNGESIWITLTPPEKKPEAIDGTTGHPGAQPQPDAGGLFAAAHGGDDDEAEEAEDDEDAGPDLEDRLDNALRAADAETSGQASKDALDAVGNPFGSREDAEDADRSAAGGEFVSAVNNTSTRTARGREATKKALAEGLAAHEAAGAK